MHARIEVRLLLGRSLRRVQRYAAISVLWYERKYLHRALGRETVVPLPLETVVCRYRCHTINLFIYFAEYDAVRSGCR